MSSICELDRKYKPPLFYLLHIEMTYFSDFYDILSIYYFNMCCKRYGIPQSEHFCRLRSKCDGTRAETRFRLSVKRMSPFKSVGASVQSTAGRRAVHISLQGLYCSWEPVFCSHVTLTGYPLHSLVSPSLLLLRVTVCHHISTGLYLDCVLVRPDEGCIATKTCRHS